MKTDIEMLQQEARQAEVKVIVASFRQALLKHFDVVTANSMRLINSRWGDDSGQDK